MGFDASQAVAALDWDFSAFGAGSGTSPEPSDQMIERFKRKQQRLATALIEQVQLTNRQVEADDEEVAIPTLIPLKEAVAAIADITGEDELASTALAQMCEITAEVLSDQPNAKQIGALPFRVRAAFFGWVTGQLLNPESLAAGTR